MHAFLSSIYFILCWQQKERGLVIEPTDRWDGLLEFLFMITGMSDENFES